MRIISIKIDHWRNFRNVQIEAPADSTLVCLVGENGTGKSNILELISAVAHKLGISPGIEIPRGDPFAEVHSFSVVIKFNESIESLLYERQLEPFAERGVVWNGQLQINSARTSEGQHNQQIIAQGFEDQPDCEHLANLLINNLNQRSKTHYLSLDADRAYPPIQIHPQHYAQALEEDWDAPAKRKNRAFAPTRTMYEEWVKYFLAKEIQDATKLQHAMRRAKQLGNRQPEFIDGFEPYKKAVQKVLPHLNFVGVDATHKTLLFDSSGTELKFTNLSGGEREISFILGQIDRFQLHQGILLIDEPELHLNPDLLRNWVAYLRDTVEDGQIWISTHSLEAVETAGPTSSFVLERTQDTRVVENIKPLSSCPILSVLSAAVGSPAFSLRNLKFVFVEGDRQGREKERFYSLYGDSRYVRFIEGGGCEEVSRKLSAVRELAVEAEEQLFVGGVIDCDFRTRVVIEELQRKTPVYVLDCHEIENLYLNPLALRVVRERAGIQSEVLDIIRSAADRFAGMWIFQKAIYHSNLQELNRDSRQSACRTWEIIDASPEQFIETVSTTSLFQSTELVIFKQNLTDGLEEYRAIRQTEHLWKKCFGKQTLGVIYQDFGMSSVETLQNSISRIWANSEAPLPNELIALRQYIDSIE